MIPIHTHEAPQAIGAYSQAVRAGDSVYISGQIPLHPRDMKIVEGGFENQAHRVFRNMRAIARAAHGDLGQIVKITVYLTDLENFVVLNEVMSEYFTPPFPARAAVEVSALPKQALLEADAILWLTPVPDAGEKSGYHPEK